MCFFIDNFTEYTWMYLIKNRSTFYCIYAAFSTMMFTKFEKKNKIFRLDSGRWNIYTSQKIWNFMVTQGTQV